MISRGFANPPGAATGATPAGAAVPPVDGGVPAGIEVAAEPEVPFEASILFQDEHLLVADKPHFLPVTPAGSYVRNSLLARLQEQTGVHDLAPLHRLDRDTAGLVLFSTDRATRGAYSRLFSEGRMAKTYHSVARVAAMKRARSDGWTGFAIGS